MLKVKSLLVLLPLCHVAAGWTYLTDSTVETFGTQFQTNVLPMAFTGSNHRRQPFHFYGFHHKDESFVDNFLVSFLCARFVMVFRDLSDSSEPVVASICVSHEPSFIY